MVDEEPASPPQGAGHPAQDRLVLGRREVSEARVEIDHRVELLAERDAPHVAPAEAQARPLGEATARLREHRAREVHPDHAEAAPREERGVAAVAAG